MKIIEDVRHRPWPLPKDPWILRQSWHDLLFAHWPVSGDRLRELVPGFLELDTFNQKTWLGVVPFRLTDLSPRGVPALPWISAFREINVRTYVIYNGIPGVYFFSLDANSALAVTGARTMFHLPYFLADINLEENRGRIIYSSRRKKGSAADFEAEYAPDGPLFEAAPDTLDYWLTERYCLYTKDAESTAYRVEIHHRPWQLQKAKARIAVNSMADAADLLLPAMTPVLHFARRQDVLTWAPHKLP